MDIFDSYSNIPHGDGENGIFRRSCLLSPFFQPSSLRLHLLLLFLLFPAAGAGGPSCCILHGPRLENVVALTRPSINDYMQVLCYIATQANKPSCPSRVRYIACPSCVCVRALPAWLPCLSRHVPRGSSLPARSPTGRDSPSIETRPSPLPPPPPPFNLGESGEGWREGGGADEQTPPAEQIDDLDIQ